MGRPWYRNKWVNVGLHAAFWVLFFLIPYLLQPAFRKSSPTSRPIHPESQSVYFNLVKCFFWMTVFYLNAYLFVPKFIYRRKYLYYFLSLFFVLVLVSTLEISYLKVRGDSAQFRISGFVIYNLFPFLFIAASGSAYRMFLDKINEENKNREKEAENLKSELSFLRSQISPHFMFNVINNIVALSRKKSELVEPSLIKLSSLLRYFLYESNAERVPLEKEVEYLESYISLQKQRFGNNLVVNLDLNDIDGHYEIEPMLLIPFVENAFKHGGMYAGEINIELRVRAGLMDYFVNNVYKDEQEHIKDETSGIGLANVRRRLDLLYPKRHRLFIEKKDGRFLVTLELKLY